MPVYTYGCPHCGTERDVIHGMRDNPTVACAKCHHICHRIPQLTSTIIPADFMWHNENGGRGHHISGLGKPSNPNAYATSLRDAQDKAKRRGMSYDLA